MNQQLARYLRDDPAPHERLTKQHTPRPTSYHAPRWRVRDRLSEQDIVEIVHAFKAGTAKHVLAKRYEINERSLKKLLREEGVKRKSWKDVQI